MKKTIILLTVLSLLVSALTLSAFATEGEGESIWVRSLAPDNDFSYATKMEFELFTDADGAYLKQMPEAGFHGYVFVKYAQEDGSTVDNPYITVSFEAETTGTYAFMLEVMASEGPIPRGGLLQIDDGETVEIKSVHDQGTGYYREYYTGLEVDLEAGTHTLTLYPHPDFDETNVKAMFFDCFHYYDITKPPETLGDEITFPEVDEPEESEGDDQPEESEAEDTDATDTDAKDTEAKDTEAKDTNAKDTEAKDTTGSDKPDDKKDAGCGSAVSGVAILLCTMAAAVALKKAR